MKLHYFRPFKTSSAIVLILILSGIFAHCVSKEKLPPVTQKIVDLSSIVYNSEDEIKELIDSALYYGQPREKQAVYESLKHIRLNCRDASYAFGGGETSVCNHVNYSAVFEAIIRNDSCDIWKVIAICGDSLAHMVAGALEKKEIKDEKLKKWCLSRLLTKDTAAALSVLENIENFGNNEEKKGLLNYYPNISFITGKTAIIRVYATTLKTADDAKSLIALFNGTANPKIRIEIAEAIVDLEDDTFDKMVISILNDKKYFIRDFSGILYRIKEKRRKVFLPAIQKMRSEGRFYDADEYHEIVKALTSVSE